MIEVIKNEDMKLSVLLKGVGNAYVNALRKSTNEIPVLAVDTVDITKNDSALFDEMLAHRIGLVPLTPEKTMTLPEDCSCKGKGCMKCTADLVLKAGEGKVMAKDMKSKTVSVIYPEMQLSFLQKDGEIELVAHARLGKGITHAKYSPGLVWTRAAPHVVLPKDKEKVKECAAVCPRYVYQLEPKLEIKNLMNCDLCLACVEECDKRNVKEKIKVYGDEKDFIVEIESWGQLKPKEILVEACGALKENIDEFLKDASKLK